MLATGRNVEGTVLLDNVGDAETDRSCGNLRPSREMRGN